MHLVPVEPDERCPGCDDKHGHRKCGEKILCETCYEKSMEVVSGGHAIMLRVELPPVLSDVAKCWLANHEGTSPDPHVTLAFVGRDLTRATGDVMVEAAKYALKALPDSITTTGQYGLFGKQDHLVALIEQDFNLVRFRDLLVHRLFDNGIHLDSTFGFNPHVSLVKMKSPPSRLWSSAGWPGCGSASFYERILKVLGIDVKLGKRIVQL